MATMSLLLFNDLDVLEHIPFYFTDIPSLASFRLTNRTCRTASLNHLEYHSIQCTLHHDDLWKSLIERPALARRVRQLTIMPEVRAWDTVEFKGEIIPPLIKIQGKRKNHFTREDEKTGHQVLEECRVSEKLLVRALRLMSNLDYFNWDAYPPVIVPSKGSDGKEYMDLWGTVRTLKNLKSFRAVDLTCDSYVPQWRMAGSPSMITSGVSPA